MRSESDQHLPVKHEEKVWCGLGPPIHAAQSSYLNLKYTSKENLKRPSIGYKEGEQVRTTHTSCVPEHVLSYATTPPKPLITTHSRKEKISKKPLKYRTVMAPTLDTSSIRPEAPDPQQTRCPLPLPCEVPLCTPTRERRRFRTVPPASRPPGGYCRTECVWPPNLGLS